MTQNALKQTQQSHSSTAGEGAKVASLQKGGSMTNMTPLERLEYMRAISPINLQYVTALRGYVPNVEGSYSYCMMNCSDGELLMAMAASNPNGNFIGFDGDEALVKAASERAAKLGVKNVAFAQADPLAFAAAVKEGKLAKPSFDYVVLNMAGHDVARDEMAQMMEMMGSILADEGIAYVGFDIDVKDPSASKDPNGALAAYKTSGKVSRTDAVQEAGKKAGLNFVGSGKVKLNYIDFSAPSNTHEALLQHMGSSYIETLKDMVIGSAQRHDVWIKSSAAPNTDVTRFAGFTFSVTTPVSYIDPQYSYFDKKLDLSTPLFTRLISVLAQYPMGFGDMIVHNDLKSATTEELLGGVMSLVAIGIAEPTSGQTIVVGDVLNAKLGNAYNQRLRTEAISGSGYLAASYLGRPVYATPTTLMCLKSIDATGIKGAETILDKLLAEASPVVKAEIPANLTDDTTRRNMAYRLLEQICQEWLGFTIVHGVMKAA